MEWPNTLAVAPGPENPSSTLRPFLRFYPFWQGISYATFALYWQQAQAPKDGDAVHRLSLRLCKFWSGASDVETFMFPEPGS